MLNEYDYISPFEKNVDEAREKHENYEEIKRLRAVLEDFAEHGIRADLTPTLSFDVPPTREGILLVISFFYSYLAAIDANIRERARKALRGG